MIKFLQRLLGKSENISDTRVQAFVPKGRRLYCIGDIHGRLDLLEELHGMILVDSADFDGNKCVIYLGDYIDRGAQSRQVLDLLTGDPLAGFDTVFLLGNHEQSMLDFLKDPEAAAAWLIYGGQVTLLSYGVGLGKPMRSQELEMLREELEEKLPLEHLDFLHACRISHIEGSYCFVHAGIRPNVPLAEQSVDDLLWIRDEFIHSRVSHEHIVVHGHTISDEVEFRPNRIGIDTGAYQSGLLSALVLEGQEQRLLQTGRT